MSPARAADFEDDLATLPKSFLRPCLLLLIHEQPSHGYDLIVRLEALGIRRGDPGGLYRTLRRLEREGLVTSSWELSSAGPARRTYHLTDEGREWMHAWGGTLRETGRLIRGFVDRYEGMFGPAGDDVEERIASGGPR